MACLSRDAKGAETTCRIEIGTEKFEAKGLVIHDRGYLEVYPYEKWGDKNLPEFIMNETFEPRTNLNEGTTNAPNLLSESDLIGLMDKYGIGTDATHADHIDTVQKRNYVSLNNDRRFYPSPLGIALVNAYDDLEIPLAGHRLRSGLEKDLEMICNGRKQKGPVLTFQIEAYKEAYQRTERNLERFYAKMTEHFGAGNDAEVRLPQNNPADDSFTLCPSCSSPMSVVTLPSGARAISCSGYPNCRTSGFMPRGAEYKGRKDQCPRCGRGYHKAAWHFPLGSVPLSMQGDHVGCINCDSDLKSVINIRINTGGNTQASRETTAHTQRAAPARGLPQNRQSSTRDRSQNKSENSKRNSSHFDGPPKCQCGVDANGPIVTRKEGANQGREFYTCGKDRSCSYFQWKDEIDQNMPKRQNSNNTKTQNNKNSAQPSAVGDAPMCQCNLPANQLMVRKEGPNCGKLFYGCGNNRSCSFFQWADEVPFPPFYKIYSSL